MIEIRPATAHDAHDIASVHVTVWREAYHGVMPQAFLDALTPEARAEAWAERLADPEDETRTLVAVRGGQVVGFCTVGPSRLDAPDGYGELHAINILVTAQHQGLGRRLMGEAARALQSMGYTGLTLSVLRDSPAGRMFYESLGGTLSGRHNDDFGDFQLPAVEYRWADLNALLA
ncbi:GNAT family N-acetyltransferase [Phenylobacterium sp.]|uniref:GNAT family N-acetyltransferase n=1 Tax=Phenylobacterium sp. TaxID=1871053 RepID=UPI002E36834A|nr:GNAT family N-acetyltransferase [Phenylobacterium sp.]HEX2560942.1 GNAT family N-acetyltransferase [Phenylobacterium sp.]